MVEDESDDFVSIDTPGGRPGTLYVMYEEDHLTKQTFDYYKIGIVLGARDVIAREKDHKTGNPRGIYTKFEIGCQSVQKLETLLHNKFAKQRVSSGEWFRFNSDQLEHLLAEVQILREKLDSKLQLFEQASVLKKLEMRSGEIPATPEILEQAKSAVELEVKIQTCEKLMKEIAKKLKQVWECDNTIEPLMKKSFRATSNKFSVTELRKQHPDLHQEFQVQKLSWISNNLLTPEISASDLCEEFGDLEAVQKESDPFELHQMYLQLWSHKSELALDLEIAESTLTTYCGSNLAVIDVFSWSQKIRNTFDSESFKAAHPEIFSSCFKQTEAKVVFSVAEWASYAHN